MNSVYLGAGQRLERVLNARQVVLAEKPIPLAETTRRGAPSTLEPIHELPMLHDSLHGDRNRSESSYAMADRYLCIRPEGLRGSQLGLAAESRGA